MGYLIYGIVLCANTLLAIEGARQRGWPPAFPSLIKDPVTGTYDIRINPHLNADAFSRSSVCHYARYFEKKAKKESGEGDCFQRAVNALPKRSYAAFNYYPQPVNHFRILKEVRAGAPVYEAPINDPPRYILKAPNTCNQKHDLVIMIESCVTCAAERAKSRTTFLNRKLWKSVNIGWVFVTGVPAKEPVKTFYFPGMNVTRNAYKEGTDVQAILSNLLTEAGKYGDILVSDFEQDGFHHVWTYIVSLRWASVFCNKKVPIFAYMQGYYSLVPGKFEKWFKTLSASKKPRYYGGHVHRNVIISHNVKWAWGHSWEEMPWTIYPPYVFRGLTVLGHDTVQEAAILSAFTRYSRILSVYIAIVNWRVRIHPSHIRGIYYYIRNKASARNAIFGRTVDTNNYINWKTGFAK